jgi:hypothetical protein
MLLPITAKLRKEAVFLCGLSRKKSHTSCGRWKSIEAERLLLIVAHGQFRGDRLEVAKEAARASVGAGSEIEFGGG